MYAPVKQHTSKQQQDQYIRITACCSLLYVASHSDRSYHMNPSRLLLPRRRAAVAALTPSDLPHSEDTWNRGWGSCEYTLARVTRTVHNLHTIVHTIPERRVASGIWFLVPGISYPGIFVYAPVQPGLWTENRESFFSIRFLSVYANRKPTF